MLLISRSPRTTQGAYEDVGTMISLGRRRRSYDAGETTTIRRRWGDDDNRMMTRSDNGNTGEMTTDRRCWGDDDVGHTKPDDDPRRTTMLDDVAG